MITDYEQLLSKLPPIIGIAPNAFSRVVPASFLQNYTIVCFKKRLETSLIQKDIDVFCVEERYPDIVIERTNAHEILSLEVVKNYINSYTNPSLLVYKTTQGVERLCLENGWRLLGNPLNLVRQFENKKSFREVLKKTGVEAIPGKTLRLEELSWEVFSAFQKEYGRTVVLQVAEMTAGGGTGTAFVRTQEEFKAFLAKVKQKSEKMPLEFVNLTKFVSGVPASIAVCMTRHGVLTGRIQTQIQDIADVRLLEEGSGLFSGHDWSFKQYAASLQLQAQKMVTRIGQYMYQFGYKGIAGFDLLIDEAVERVYPVECNPRYTDAFPVLSMMHQAKGILPLDVFHILEHASVDYELDFGEQSRDYNQPFEGAQIILETRSKYKTVNMGEVSAGVYKVLNTKLKKIRDGYHYKDLQNRSEFLVTEGVPLVNTVFKPGARILRLVRKGPLLKTQHSLLPEAQDIILKIYKQLDLKEIR